MRRRAFLEAAAFSAIGSVTAPAPAGAVSGQAGVALGRLQDEKAIQLADRLLDAYPLQRSLAEIGGAYWREAASADDACRACLQETMEGFLQHLDLAEEALKKMSSAAIRVHVESGSMVDFAKGRIVPVRGWLLGETEARLCMIAALRAA